jgi:hypothetical protein
VRTILDPKYGGLHAGFLGAFQNVWLDNSRGSGLATILAELGKAQERTVWFTGHSLGGALATLAAFWYEGKSTLYTFGSPRVGNATFRAKFGNRSAFRITHATDIVPTVPHIMCHARPNALESFEHVGRHYAITTSSRVDVSESNEPDRATQWPGYFNVAANTLKALGTEWMSAFPQQRIADHAPTYYASLLWNALPH